MVNFFIDRPVFAWVLAIVIMLMGALAITTLPIAQYPSIAPPAISIQVTYPGASADTVQSAVTQVIEQQMSGIDHLLYFGSESDADGSMTITLYFEQGTNPDIAQVQVQNKLQLATPLLPVEVQQEGLRVAKATRNFLLVIGFYSSDGSMSSEDVSDYIASYVQDPISRTPGVGDYQLFGTQYAMRIWLDPVKLNNYGLTPTDVNNALQVQNLQVPAGELGGLPSVKGQRLHATIIGPERLTSAEAFGRVLLKVNTDGSQVRLRDVARIGLGAESYSIHTEYNGKPAAGLAVKLAPGANALETANAVRATMDKLAPFFPPGLKLVYPYDTTPFVRVSIDEVVKTLFEAIVLVFLVMYLFLQNFRATLIPTIAVPVVLLGTFGILAAAGFSINTLTMFGMVLAIGLLVDDAIVVVENVERVMEEEKLSPKDATRRSMARDHRRPGRHRPGAIGGIPAHGLLRRLYGCHLPSVLHHHRLGHGAVGDGGADLHAFIVRDAPQAAGRGGPRARARVLRLVQSRLQPDESRLRARGHSCHGAHAALPRGVRAHRGGDGPAVRARAEILPAG